MAICSVDELLAKIEEISGRDNLVGLRPYLEAIVESGVEYNKQVNDFSYDSYDSRRTQALTGIKETPEKEINTEVSNMKIEDIHSEMIDEINDKSNGFNDLARSKDSKKVKLATKFIGHGEPGSHTDKYFDLFNKYGLANRNEYTADDVVFVSVNGGNKNPVRATQTLEDNDTVSLKGVYSKIDDAMDAGADIIMDTEYHAKRNHNVKGEGAVFDYMVEVASSKGYELYEYGTGSESYAIWKAPLALASEQHNETIIQSVEDITGPIFSKDTGSNKIVPKSQAGNDALLTEDPSKDSVYTKYTIDTSGNIRALTETKLSDEENFSNPFKPEFIINETSDNETLRKHKEKLLPEEKKKEGLSRIIKGMTREESMIAFYNWIADGDIPENYDGDIVKLGNKRQFIIDNYLTILQTRKFASSQKEDTRPFTVPEVLYALAAESFAFEEVETTELQNNLFIKDLKSAMSEQGLIDDEKANSSVNNSSVNSDSTQKTIVPGSSRAITKRRKWNKAKKEYGKKFNKKTYYSNKIKKRNTTKNKRSYSKKSKIFGKGKKTFQKNKRRINYSKKTTDIKYNHQPIVLESFKFQEIGSSAANRDNTFLGSLDIKENRKEYGILLPEDLNQSKIHDVTGRKENIFKALKKFVANAKKNPHKIYYIDEKMLTDLGITFSDLKGYSLISAIESTNIVFPKNITDSSFKNQGSITAIFNSANKKREKDNKLFESNRKYDDIALINKELSIYSKKSVKYFTTRKVNKNNKSKDKYPLVYALSKAGVKKKKVNGKYASNPKSSYSSFNSAVAALRKSFDWSNSTISPEEFAYTQILSQNNNLIQAIERSGGIENIDTSSFASPNSLKKAYNNLSSSKKSSGKQYNDLYNKNNPDEINNGFYTTIESSMENNNHISYLNTDTDMSYDNIIEHNKNQSLSNSEKYISVSKITSKTNQDYLSKVDLDSNHHFGNPFYNKNNPLEAAHKYLMWIAGRNDVLENKYGVSTSEIEKLASRQSWIETQLSDDNSMLNTAYKNNTLFVFGNRPTSLKQTSEYSSDHVPSLIFAIEHIDEIFTGDRFEEEPGTTTSNTSEDTFTVDGQAFTVDEQIKKAAEELAAKQKKAEEERCK